MISFSRLTPSYYGHHISDACSWWTVCDFFWLLNLFDLNDVQDFMCLISAPCVFSYNQVSGFKWCVVVLSLFHWRISYYQTKEFHFLKSDCQCFHFLASWLCLLDLSFVLGMCQMCHCYLSVSLLSAWHWLFFSLTPIFHDFHNSGVLICSFCCRVYVSLKNLLISSGAQEWWAR